MNPKRPFQTLRPANRILWSLKVALTSALALEMGMPCLKLCTLASNWIVNREFFILKLLALRFFGNKKTLLTRSSPKMCSHIRRISSPGTVRQKTKPGGQIGREQIL